MIFSKPLGALNLWRSFPKKEGQSIKKREERGGCCKKKGQN
jgi:hypothetical protein